MSTVFTSPDDVQRAYARLAREVRGDLKVFHEQDRDKCLLEQTVAKLNQMLELDPERAEAYAWLAYAMFLIKVDSLARKYLKKALELEPALPLVQKVNQLLTEPLPTDLPFQIRKVKRLSQES